MRRFIRYNVPLNFIGPTQRMVLRSLSNVPGGDNKVAAVEAPSSNSKDDEPREDEVLLYKESQHKTIMVMLGVSGVNFMVSCSHFSLNQHFQNCTYCFMYVVVAVLGKSTGSLRNVQGHGCSGHQYRR